MNPVTDIAFPAVTICTASMNLNAVKAALRLDQMEWEKNREESSGRKKRDAQDRDHPGPEYLRSRFGSPDFPVLEVVKGLGSSSPDPMAASILSGVHNYASICLQGVNSEKLPIIFLSALTALYIQL